MTSLEGLKPDAAVRGILPDALVTVVGVRWHGSDVLELTYKSVVPAGLIARMTGRPVHEVASVADTQASAARAPLMSVESGLGCESFDRKFERLSHDIESRDSRTGRLRFFEVKGRVAAAVWITVTRNEILYSLNKPDDFILAIVEFLDDSRHRVHYLRKPFDREPGFGVTIVNYDSAELLARDEPPA